MPARGSTRWSRWGADDRGDAQGHWSVFTKLRGWEQTRHNLPGGQGDVRSSVRAKATLQPPKSAAPQPASPPANYPGEPERRSLPTLPAA